MTANVTPLFKPLLHEQFSCDNFYVTNIFDSVDGTANKCQQLKVSCTNHDFGQLRYAE